MEEAKAIVEGKVKGKTERKARLDILLLNAAIAPAGKTPDTVNIGVNIDSATHSPSKAGLEAEAEIEAGSDRDEEKGKVQVEMTLMTNVIGNALLYELLSDSLNRTGDRERGHDRGREDEVNVDPDAAAEEEAQGRIRWEGEGRGRGRVVTVSSELHRGLGGFDRKPYFTPHPHYPPSLFFLSPIKFKTSPSAKRYN